MITKKSRLLSLVLSMGLLLSMAVSGCTDKDRDPSPVPTPTPVPGTTTEVYVNVSALDLAYDALYCTINASEDVDGEEPADEAFQVEVNEDGLGLIAENQEIGSPISFTLSFQLEGKEVATYEAQDVIVNPEEEDRFIIVVDEVVPVIGEDIDVYVNISDVKVGYSKVVLKGEEEDTELEFDEDGVSTTPVATVKEGEKAKFSLSFVQSEIDITQYIGEETSGIEENGIRLEDIDLGDVELSSLEFTDKEIATYDVSEEGVEVVAEDGQAIVAIDEVTIASPCCLTFDLSQMTASKEYFGCTLQHAVMAMLDLNKLEEVTSFEDLLDCLHIVYVDLQKKGTGFMPINIDGLDKSKYIGAVMFIGEGSFGDSLATYGDTHLNNESNCLIIIEDDLTIIPITDDDIL